MNKKQISFDIGEDDYQEPYIIRREEVDKPQAWQVKHLGELVELEYGNSLPKKKRKQGSYPVYGSNGRSGWHSDFHVKAPGIIVGRKGVNLGVEWSDRHFNVIDTAYYINSDSLKNDQVNLLFLYYKLLNFDLNRLKSGSAVPGLNRNDFYEETVALPPMEEQERIANIFSSLDEKVKANDRIRYLLDDMVKILFKNRLLDFNSYEGDLKYDEDFDRRVPKEWGKKPLEEIANFMNGKAWQQFESDDERNNLPVMKIKELRKGVTEKSDKVRKEDCPEDYIINNGTVIFSWSASLLLKIWTDGEAFLNQHLFKVTSENYPKWFYYGWIDHYINKFRNIAEAKKTTMGHIKRSDLREAKVLIPTQNDLEQISDIMKPIFNTMINVQIENTHLSELREVLLPKLMSGELRVNPDVDE